jgi:hypothetical protein
MLGKMWRIKRKVCCRKRNFLGGFLEFITGRCNYSYPVEMEIISTQCEEN